MDFSAFDDFLSLIDQIGNLTGLVADAFSYLPRLFIDYWVAILLAIVIIGVFTIIIRVVS